jgi:hypothetical protein
MAASATPSAPPAPLPEPLRLPRGSVHGILALVLMGTFAYLVVRGTAAPQVLVNAVVVCLAFYFGSHAAPATPAGAPGTTPSRRPRIVRALLFLGFAGLTAWLLRTGLFLSNVPPQLQEIWQVLGGYILGLSLSWAFHRRVHESPLRRRLALLFRDLSALGALGLTVFACYALGTGIASGFSTYVEQALSLVITYYFGSRVIAH